MNHVINCTILGTALSLIGPAVHAGPPVEPPSEDRTQPAAFRVPAMWEYSAPLIAPEKRDRDPSRAQKDSTVVFYGGKWHVFMTVKLPGRSAIEYCSFERWEDADGSRRTILRVSDSDYYCAPQIFYFAPHKKWYLIYQMGVPGAKYMWVAYSTTTTIADPSGPTCSSPA
ncbi:MAG: non-reducing end alpha-L-arabinofuranosidase family hydrolase [Planctomycetota bacterium]